MENEDDGQQLRAVSSLPTLDTIIGFWPAVNGAMSLDLAELFVRCCALVLVVLVSARWARRQRKARLPAPGERAMSLLLGPPVAPTAHPTASATSAAHAARWRPREDDVIVLSFPKTGTTWVQQVCEQLRSRGSMDFAEISQRQPWLEFALDVGQSLDAPHAHGPRVFKSHQRPAAAPRGCKYIITVRAPEATLASHFAFMAHKQVEAVRAFSSADEYATRSDHWFGNDIFGTTYFEFVREAWRIRHLPCVLLISYELMLEQPEAHARRIAAFLGVVPAPALVRRAVERSRKEFMLAHAHQFDDSWLAAQQRALGRSRGVITPGPKVTAEHREPLAPYTRALLASVWREVVTPTTGLGSYDELLVALREEQPFETASPS